MQALVQYCAGVNAISRKWKAVYKVAESIRKLCKRLICTIDEEWQFNYKNIQFINRQCICVDISPRRVCNWPLNTWKMPNVISHWGNVDKRHNETPFNIHCEGFYYGDSKIKRRETNVSKGVEKFKSSDNPHGKLCDSCGQWLSLMVQPFPLVYTQITWQQDSRNKCCVQSRISDYSQDSEEIECSPLNGQTKCDTQVQ